MARIAPPRCSAKSATPKRRRGLTLVELLVGVGCLAILVPLLAAAGDAATRPNRERMCAFRLGRLGTAMLQYTVDNDGYLPGSPGTSGTQLIYEYANLPSTTVDIPIALTQIWDWAAPLTPYLGVATDRNRARRVEQYREGQFWCPANDLISYPYANGSIGPFGDWRPIRTLSYLTMRNFMFFGSSAPPAPSAALWASVGSNNQTEFPSTYYPRLDLLGTASEKAFLADGARFTESNGIVDHDITALAFAGGMYSDGGPTIPELYLRSYLIDPPLREYSYRHTHGETPGINVAFFDGHVSWMSEPASRHARWWWPTGTVIPIQEMNRSTLIAVWWELEAGRTRYVVP